MNFKLLKSNSCSSRLELVGTNEADAKTFKSTIVDVKEIIKKLENTTLISNNFRPRIIESACIEKIPVTVNKQIILSDVTSMNNINHPTNKQTIQENRTDSKDKTRTLKINRNKNVDLAFGMKMIQTKKPLLENNIETNIINSEMSNEDLSENQIQQDPNHDNIRITNNENPYGKHYVLNDNRVFEKSSFEIEFEEFEIYDPVNK